MAAILSRPRYVNKAISLLLADSVSFDPISELDSIEPHWNPKP